MASRPRAYAYGASLAALTALAGCFAAPGRPEQPAHPAAEATNVAAVGSPGLPETPAPEGGPEYVGDAACVTCHRSESDLHRRSRHFNTVRPVSLAADATKFQQAVTIRDTAMGATYHLSVQSGSCVQIAQTPSSRQSTEALYSFGSRLGRSYLGRVNSDEWVEMRLSYYPDTHTWDYTPFLQPDPQYPQYLSGLPQSAREVAICFSCHVTTFRLNALAPDLAHSHLGVGCERCHGPGREHIAAVYGGSRSAAGALGMVRLGQQSRNDAMALCGRCHSSSRDIPAQVVQTAAIARFPSNALRLSRCYTASGTLQCATCHNAHGLGAPSGGYEAVCLSCHGARVVHTGGSPATGQSSSAGRAPVICKVNPTSGCIRCHMPLQTTRSFARVGFHNHWIKVYPQ